MRFTRALTAIVAVAAAVWIASPAPARAEGEWEITPQSEEALARGLQWLAANQGPKGNWGSENLGLVSMGALAFMSAGHMPGRGKYGDNVHRALDYVVRNERPPGLLNCAIHQYDMYNHGLSTFVLGQAYGMSNDARLSPLLDRALKLIIDTQCEDGGWEYQAKRTAQGHDLSLVVMQAKALRSAIDSGLDIPLPVIQAAIQAVRAYYAPEGCPYTADEATQKKCKGQFSYGKGGGQKSLAMAAAGVVCLQEFAQYDDWRIPKNMELITAEVRKALQHDKPNSRFPDQIDAYTLYYVGQALYQVGGRDWRECYPLLREGLVNCQIRKAPSPAQEGMFQGQSREGSPLYFQAVACFILAIPNRYLPILQEGKIESLRERLQQKVK